MSTIELLDSLIDTMLFDGNNEYLLPSDFGDDDNAAQLQELVIMTKCAYKLYTSINAHQIKQQLSIKNPEFNQHLHYFLSNCHEILKNNNKDDEKINKLILSPKMSTAIYTILSDYNYYIRLKLQNQTLESLHKMQKMFNEFNPSLLPPPTPSEVVLPELWTNTNNRNEEKKSPQQNQWIGHGYYYKHGIGPKFTDLYIDYDCLEDKFMKLTKAKVIMADYNLLRKDFSHHLTNMNNKQINKWLIENCAYFAQGQINRMLKKYANDKTDNIDVNHYLKFDDTLTINDFIDFNDRKCGLRQRGGGRAATFLIDNKYKITSNGLFKADMLDVKGVGTHILCSDLDQKKNGFLSGMDAVIEFAYQKLIQRIFDIENKTNEHHWNTVEMYAIIDTGLQFKTNIENPATGYKGDKIALIIRQRQSRLSASNDEACFFSVAQYKQLRSEQGCILRQILLKYGITSEQIPTSYLLENNNDELNGEWNIQSDAAFSHLVDFSQFYCYPNNNNIHIQYGLELNEWRMSMNAFKLGCKLGRVIDEIGDKLSEDMLINIFGDDEDEDKKEDINLEVIKKKIKSQQQVLKSKHAWGDLIGLRKPKHAWSWFLETDDSNIVEWAKKQTEKFSNDLFTDDSTLFNQIPLPT